MSKDSKTTMGLILYTAHIQGIEEGIQSERQRILAGLPEAQRKYTYAIMTHTLLMLELNSIMQAVTTGTLANSDRAIIQSLQGRAGMLARAFVNYREANRYMGDLWKEEEPLVGAVIQAVELATNGDCGPIREFVLKHGNAKFADLVMQMQGVARQGRPAGMGESRRLLAERVLQETEGTAAEKIRKIQDELGRWDKETRRWIPHEGLTPEQEMIFEVVEKVKAKEASKYVDKLLRDFKQYSTKTFS